MQSPCQLFAHQVSNDDLGHGTCSTVHAQVLYNAENAAVCIMLTCMHVKRTAQQFLNSINAPWLYVPTNAIGYCVADHTYLGE